MDGVLVVVGMFIDVVIFADEVLGCDVCTFIVDSESPAAPTQPKQNSIGLTDGVLVHLCQSTNIAHMLLSLY